MILLKGQIFYLEKYFDIEYICWYCDDKNIKYYSKIASFIVNFLYINMFLNNLKWQLLFFLTILLILLNTITTKSVFVEKVLMEFSCLFHHLLLASILS